MSEESQAEAPPLKYEFTVNGKRVWLRKRLPLREQDALLELAAACSNTKPRTNIPVMARLIESWEFAGDPADPEAYEDLDLLDEFLPLVEIAGTYLAGRLARAGILKNWGGASS